MNHRTGSQPQDFERLVGEHLGRIRGIARRFAVPGALDDLVQEILTRLWRSFPGFRGEAKVESWIYRVALNAAMSHVAQTVKNRNLQAAIQAAPGSTAGPPGADAGDILADFLARLGDVDASIMMMYLDGLTAEDMGDVLGISPNGINVRINRLKQKFTDIYV